MRTLLSAIGLGTLLLSGCAQEHDLPTPDALLLMGLNGGDSDRWNAAYLDCRTDSILDGVTVPRMSLPAYAFGSPGGKYFIVDGWGSIRLWDIRSEQMVSYASGSIGPDGRCVFMPELQRMVAAGYSATTLYHCPSMVMDTAFNSMLFSPIRIPNSNRLLAITRGDGIGMPINRSVLVSFDVESRQITDSILITDANGNAYEFLEVLNLSPDGQSVCAFAMIDYMHVEILKLERRTGRVLFRVPTISGADCRFTPDGQEIWYTDPMQPDVGPPVGFPPPHTPGVIVILDVQSGAILDTIFTTGLTGDEEIGLEVDDLRFSPSGDKAYVSSRRTRFLSLPPLLVIDVHTRSVRKLLYLPHHESVENLEMMPKYGS